MKQVLKEIPNTNDIFISAQHFHFLKKGVGSFSKYQKDRKDMIPYVQKMMSKRHKLEHVM